MQPTDTELSQTGSTLRPGRGCVGVYTPAPRAPSPDEKSADAPRYEVSTKDFHLFGYPSTSDGGLIALENASAADLSFLELDPVELRKTRFPTQKEEDDFCRRLLRLGARRWETLERFRQAMGALDNDELILDNMRGPHANIPRLTVEEMRWVIAAWPSSGGVWVSDLTRTYELDSRHASDIARGHDLYLEAARLRLAEDMNVKARMLESHFQARHYTSWEEYRGSAIQ